MGDNSGLDVDVASLLVEGHGAVQVESGEDANPPFVFLAGPIRFWWAEGQWGSELHQRYTKWRDDVRIALVRAGCLVYSPHRAWQGRWNERAQEVNDAAIRACTVVLDLRIPGVPADGTLQEVETAVQAGVPVVPLALGDTDHLGRIIVSLPGTLLSPGDGGQQDQKTV
jgi:hypothetical protein